MRKFIKRNRFFILLFILGSVAGAVALLSLITIDISQYNSFITTRVEERINGAAHLGRITLNLAPLPYVTVEGVTMYDETDVIIEAPLVTIVVSPISLIKRKFIMRELSLHNPHIRLRIEEDSTLNFSRFIKRPTPPKRLKVIGGTVIFSDDRFKTQPYYAIGKVNGTVNRTRGEAIFAVEGNVFPGATVTLSGRVEGKKETLQIKGKMDVKGAYGEIFKPYLKPYLKGGAIDLNADLKGNFSYHRGAFEMKGDAAYRSLRADVPSLFTTPLASPNGSAGIAIEHRGAITDIVVSRATVGLDGFTLNGDGSLQASPGRRYLTLHINDTTIPLASLDERISQTILPERLAKSKNELTLTGGEVLINALTMSCTLDELSEKGFYKRPGRLTTAATIRNGAFHHIRLPYPVTGLTGAVFLENGKLRAEGLSGNYGESAIQHFNGVVDDGAYRANLEAVIDGEEFTKTVKILFKDTLPPIIEKVEATGSATIKVAVSKGEEASAKLSYSGTAALNDAGILYADFAPPLHSLTGSVTFNPEILTLTDIAGGAGNGSIALDGEIANYRSKRPEPALTFSGLLTDDVAQALWQERLPDDFFIKGGVKFAGSAVAGKEAINIDGHLDSKAAAINLPPFIAKEWDFPLSADLHLISKENALTIKSAAITAGASSLSVGGVISKKRGSYSLSISSSQLHLNDLDMILPHLESSFDSTGTLALNLKLTRKTKSSRSHITGEALVKGGSFSSSFMARDISRLDGVVTFNGNTAKSHIEALDLGKSSLSGDLDITDLNKRTVTFKLTSPYLDLKDVAAKKKVTSVKKGSGRPSFLTTVSGSGTLTVKEGQFFFLKVSSCDSRLHLTHEKMHFSPISCTIGDGRVSGEVDYFTANLPTLFSLSLNLDNVEWESFLRDLGVKRKTLSGKVSGPLHFSGRRWVRPVTKGFDGTASLTSTKGKLWRFKLVGTIFSIVNIISIDEALKSGLPYKQLSGDFKLKDGIVTTDSIIFNSDSMKASAVGSIDLVNGTIDTKMGVQPLVTIDKILTSIPLAGWIIGGDEKSSVKMYYDIKGSLKRPEIKPLPVQSIGKSVLGIFERVLVTPVRIVEPMVKPFVEEKNQEENLSEPTPEQDEK